MMAVLTDNKAALVVGVVVAGAFLGVNNTVITEARDGGRPGRAPGRVARRTPSSASRAAPSRRTLAGRLGEDVSVHAPFWMGAAAVWSPWRSWPYGRRYLPDETPRAHSQQAADLVAVGDLD